MPQQKLTNLELKIKQRLENKTFIKLNNRDIKDIPRKTKLLAELEKRKTPTVIFRWKTNPRKLTLEASDGRELEQKIRDNVDELLFVKTWRIEDWRIGR